MQEMSVTRIVSALSFSELEMQQHGTGFVNVRNRVVNCNTDSLIIKLRLNFYKPVPIKLCFVTSPCMCRFD